MRSAPQAFRTPVRRRLRIIEQDLVRLDARVSLLVWMIGFNLAITAAALGKLLMAH